MDDNANYDFVRLAEGDFPELAREVQEKRAEAANRPNDIMSGAVTDTLIDNENASTDLFGVVQRAAAIAGASRQRVIANLDRRKFLLGATTFSAGLIAGPWIENKTGLGDFGKNRYELDRNVNYSPLWNMFSNDKILIADRFSGVSPDPDTMATIKHLIFVLSKHGNSFPQTDDVIPLYDRFLSENPNSDLQHYLTYRKAIDYRYIGFPDTSFEITKNIDLATIADKRLRCYISDNFHLQCTQNSNSKKPISKIISDNSRKFLDFNVSDYSSENWSFIYQNYGPRGLLQIKDYFVNVIKETNDQNEAWLIYEEYRRFAIFCMTLDEDFERYAGGVPVDSLLIPIWGASAIAAKFLSHDWLRVKEVFSDVYELGFAPDRQKLKVQAALDAIRTKQSSPVIIQLGLLQAIFNQKTQGNGLDTLEKMLPRYEENLREKIYCNRLAREVFYAARQLGNQNCIPPSDLFDPRFEGQSPIFNVLKLHFDHALT